MKLRRSLIISSPRLVCLLLPLLLLEVECQWPSRQRQIFQQSPAPRYEMSPIPREGLTATNEFPSSSSLPKLVTRKFIRRNLSQDPAPGQDPVNQARFLSWLFGSRYPQPYPPPVPDHGPEYCVEYFDPLTGLFTEECTPIY